MMREATIDDFRALPDYTAWAGHGPNADAIATHEHSALLIGEFRAQAVRAVDRLVVDDMPLDAALRTYDAEGIAGRVLGSVRSILIANDIDPDEGATDDAGRQLVTAHMVREVDEGPRIDLDLVIALADDGELAVLLRDDVSDTDTLIYDRDEDRTVWPDKPSEADYQSEADTLNDNIQRGVY
ncbi:hypothetical protein [Frankia sp. AgW1.1]|uniref:hypothetical protein n=1 Tax=Frankia sp. AgW1.1 TaxID=1836971 RepID=UPI001EE4B99A|nr:hypothetical protein [Frankia sp. AgW1.1]MBL7487069.1 hypothetical protein [Frankia sp. AgW1.1]